MYLSLIINSSSSQKHKNRGQIKRVRAKIVKGIKQSIKNECRAENIQLLWLGDVNNVIGFLHFCPQNYCLRTLK